MVILQARAIRGGIALFVPPYPSYRVAALWDRPKEKQEAGNYPGEPTRSAVVRLIYRQDFMLYSTGTVAISYPAVGRP